MEKIENSAEVVLGVDTHLDVHVGVIIDAVGRVQGTLAIATNPNGYEQLLTWAQGFGVLLRAGVEGTGSYGAGLTHYLESRGILVIEVNRPDRSRRRSRGKSDPTDAESAARTVPGKRCELHPQGPQRPGGGAAHAERGASQRRQSQDPGHESTPSAAGQRAVVRSRWGPQEVKPERCVAACAELTLDDTSPVLVSLKMTLRLLAKRWSALHEELCVLDKELARLTKLAAPRLLERFGVGPQTAATLLVTAGDNPTRLRSEAALAALCGVSPLEASSGKVCRHRLNRGGQRQANNALWTIAMVRMRSDARTREYVVRRTREGLSKKEIHRCLKRYIVRELYPLILADLKDSMRPA